MIYDDEELGIPFVYHHVYYRASDGKSLLMIVNYRHAWCLFIHDNAAIVEEYYDRIEREKHKHNALKVLLHYYRLAKGKRIFYQKTY